MSVRVRRLMAISAIVAGIVVLAALIALHTTAVQSRVLAWSIAELERRFDLNLTADRLHYNLFSRRVTLTNVRLAAKGHEDQPFFGANAVTVQLPWAVFRGMLRFDDIYVDEGRVLVYRDENGISNLPPGRGRRDPNAPPRKIDARGLTVRNLDFAYRDLGRDIDITVQHVRTDLTWKLGEGASGPFVFDSDLIVRVGKRRVVVAPVQGKAAFDGTNLDLADVNLKTTEGSVAVNGTITRILDMPTLDLALKGTVDLDRAASWAPPPVGVAGDATLEGTMKGAPSAFELDTVIAAQRATIGHERNVRIRASSRLTPNSIVVSKALIDPATGGHVDASLEMPFGRVPWWLVANYRGVDAAAAFRMAEVSPLPFGAVIEGEARLDSKPGKPLRIEIHNTSAPRSARGTAPLQGDVVFVVDADRWSARQRHRIASTTVSGNIGGVWNRQRVTRSTFGGRLDVTTGNVGEAARYAALFGLGTPQIVRDTRGPMSANVRLAGTFEAPRFIGAARSGGVDIPGLGRTALTADFDASDRALNATNIDATIGTAYIKGDVSANLVNRGLTGALQIDAPSASDLLTALPEGLRLEGPLSATATLGGTVDRPQVAATVTGNAMTLGGQPVDSLIAEARVVGSDVIVDTLTLTQGPGSLTATGRYSLGSRTYAVDAQGQQLSWEGPLGRLGTARAQFSLRFSGGGSIDRPTGEGIVEFDLSGGLAGALVGHGTANVRLTGDTALVTATIPSLGAFIDAKVVPRRPFNYDAILVANKVDLGQLLTLSGMHGEHVTGTASLSATASGALSAIEKSRAFLNLQDIDADVEGVPIKLASPSRLSWDGSGLTIDTIDLSVGQSGRLHATGRLSETGGARWESNFRGELGDLVRIGRPFGVPDELQATGAVLVDWKSNGGLEQSTANISLTAGSVTWAALPSVNNLVIDATYNGATLDITRLTGDWQDGSISGTASIPRAVIEGRTRAAAAAQPGFAKLRVVGLSEAAFAPWLSKAVLSNIDGRVSATLDASIPRASLDAVTGQLVLDEANFTVSGVHVNQIRPSILTIDGGVVTAKDVVWNAGGSELTLTGNARLMPTEKAALDFALRGTADLQILSAFAPTVATGGTAKINIGVGGTPSTPVLSGRIDVANGEMIIREPRVVVSELNGTIAFDGRRLLFDNFNGSANGGMLVLDGGFLLTGFRPTSGALTVQLERAALDYPQGLMSESDALLTLRPEPTGWSLAGDVIVARSVYNETISIAALAAARQPRAPAAPGERRPLRQLRLNIFVATREDLRVDNNYARLEAGGAIRIVGTLDEPILGGRIELSEGGEVYLLGRTFHVAHGSISFTNPSRFEPEFDVELQTRVGATDLTLTLNGPMEKLQTEVRSSDPDVDSREAMSMLFGNFRGEDAVTLLSAELLGATGRAVGLDTLRVERDFETDEFRADPGLIATETDPATRLTLSKRLRSDVEITLSQSLRESGKLSAIVSYKPRRNVEIRGISRDNIDRAIALRHEIIFGGPARPEDRRPPPPRISAVTISGQPGRPTDELLGLLKLQEGDRFDFYRWQRDIDKLRSEYQDRQYYEVRVHGTREVGEDGQTVALDYEILPGPVAELVIEGHPLEQELEDELRDSWRRTIFDRFLLEDIESRITRHLLSEDVIGSDVDAVIALSTPERKQVRVTVNPGTAVASRRVEYTGNQAFGAKDLDAVITGADLDVDGWLEPPRLARTLESYYRNEGFLAATVTAGNPEVRGVNGVLPVTIEEGPRFSLGTVMFPGVDPSRETDVRIAAGLESGTPYVTTGVDAARRRVRDLYAERGFNTATVEVEPAPDANTSTVTLAFNVSEGPQQLLREVVTQGATQTREGVLTRALRLHVGEPVNLASWSRSRKRLYDTNVFRQVDIEPVPMEATSADTAAVIQPVRAVVRLIEYPVWRLRYGLQLNDETTIEDRFTAGRQQSLGVLTDIRNQNLFGRAITAGLASRFERTRRTESLFLSNSSFFGLPIRTSGFVFDSHQRVDQAGARSFIRDRRGASVEQRWRPRRLAEVTYSYRFERAHIFDPDPPPGDSFPLDKVSTVSKLSASMLLDRRNDAFEPTRGWFSSINWDQALTALGSEVGTARLLLQQYFFRQLGRVVFATRGQIGIALTKETLLTAEPFTLGGATTVRGYAEESLGPREPSGILSGGNALLLLNAEARFPVRGWVQGVVFADAGDVFRNRSDLSIGDLKYSYGIGLRLASPFAMLRLDFGIPASTIEGEQVKRKGRFYIGIGHIF